jgi:hypothetical protein
MVRSRASRIRAVAFKRIEKKPMRTYAMLSLLTLGAAAFLIASTASAQSSEPLSRQQVRAELDQARRSGALNAELAALYSPSLAQAVTAQLRANEDPPQVARGRERKDVVAEVKRARLSGELNRSPEELYGVGTLAVRPSTLRTSSPRVGDASPR